jgi:hypothetical protein
MRRTALALIGLGQSHNPFGHLPAEGRDTRGAGFIVQKALDALLHEPLLRAQTHVFDLPVCRMMAFVPMPSTLSNTIVARQTCFCGALRSRVMARSRLRSERVSEMDIRCACARIARKLIKGNPTGILPPAGSARATWGLEGSNGPATVGLSPPFLQMAYTYLVPTGSSLRSVVNADQPARAVSPMYCWITAVSRKVHT